MMQNSAEAPKKNRRVSTSGDSHLPTLPTSLCGRLSSVI